MKKISETRNLTETSLKGYRNLLNKIYKEHFKGTFQLEPKHFLNYDDINEYLKHIKSDNTRKAMVIAILVCISIDKNFPREIRRQYLFDVYDLNELQKEKYEKKQLSDREKENWISYSDILKRKKEIQERLDFYQNKREGVKNFLQYLIVCLYTELPPLRNDWCNVIVKERIKDDLGLDRNYNYIDLKRKILILCNYKTKNTYKQKKIQLPLSLVSLIRKWFLMRLFLTGKNPDVPYLLVRHDNFQPFTTVTMYRYLSDIFKPYKVGSSMIRKIYLSEKYPVINVSYKDMKDDSYAMGHSIKTQQNVYRRKVKNANYHHDIEEDENEN